MKTAKHTFPNRIILESTSYCNLIRGDCLIVWNGFVYVCCHSMDDDLCLGNVENHTIQSLFNGEKREKILEMHRKGAWDRIPPCRDCVQEWSFKSKSNASEIKSNPKMEI